MTIYKTKYKAYKAKSTNEKVVKVCGGYAVMTIDEYFVWKNQK